MTLRISTGRDVELTSGARENAVRRSNVFVFVGGRGCLGELFVGAGSELCSGITVL